MDSHYTYLIIDFLSVIFPFLFSFENRWVRFYRKWKSVSKALLSAGAFLILWDSLFVYLGVWWFNPKYIFGVKLLNLPIEEVLFFVCIPFSCLFIYECLTKVITWRKRNLITEQILFYIGIILMLCSLFVFDKLYTFSAFFLSGFVLCISYVFRERIYVFNALHFLSSFFVCLIPFFIVNGVLTRLPVVCYNDGENLGFRITSIPVEDLFFNLFMLFSITACYAFFERKSSIN
jgi:lycopene cyclase domain-containing protein